MGATVVHNEIFLRSPIRREMGGNYTCVLMSATMEGTSVSAVFVVAVHGEWSVVRMWGWVEVWEGGGRSGEEGEQCVEKE